MINLKTKDRGMIYKAPNGQEYTIYHDYFKVVDFTQVSNENKYRIQVYNSKYNTVVTPFIDTKEDLTIGCTIKMAYIITDYGINCHGYEVVDIDIPELSNISKVRSLIFREQEVDIAKYKSILMKYINSISSESLRSFVLNILDKKSDKFYIWPAATNVHHNMRSGLLLHTVNVVKNAFNIMINYSDIDRDIVIAGAVLHDIGKIYEYDEQGNISGEGKLFDHINIGTRIIFEEYYHGEDCVYSFSERDLQHLAHIILSHHGKLEWGSSRTPATQEAKIVHYADYIDTNMYTTHKVLSTLDVDQSINDKYAGQTVQIKLNEMSREYDVN